MKVLAIGAHPDDIENFCAGTLILLADQGHEIFIAIATKGDIGHPTGTREKIALMRQEEAQASCDLIGAKLIWMGYDDEFLFSNRESRLSFIDAIREAQPDLMFILSEQDYHPDHRIAGTIARDARIPASVPLIKTAFPPAEVPTTFIMDTYLGQNFVPEGYVDVTSVIERRKEMLAQHVSQVAWMERIFETDMDDDSTRIAKQRGQEAGVPFAEGFQLLGDHPRVGGWELLPNVIGVD